MEIFHPTFIKNLNFKPKNKWKVIKNKGRANLVNCDTQLIVIRIQLGPIYLILWKKNESHKY